MMVFEEMQEQEMCRECELVLDFMEEVMFAESTGELFEILHDLVEEAKAEAKLDFIEEQQQLLDIIREEIEAPFE